MRVVVLLSAGRHPVSGRAILPPLEAQAIAMALALDPHCYGLHAGCTPDGVADAPGYGLPSLDLLTIDADVDPVPALAADLSKRKPDLIVAGRRGQGGNDTGLLPYALAEALHLPLLNDIVSAAQEDSDGMGRFEQALPKGAKRRVTMLLPAIVTVHPLAPAAAPFAYAKARRGTIEFREGPSGEAAPGLFETRSRRARPKLMRQADAESDGGGAAIIDPDPDDAARMIVDYLERLGVRRLRNEASRTTDHRD
ncbi:hypothetical protein B7H23_12530 [Notoacmeibacter marinus]|uniref:Electron transfer flavoprotein alpha/beta-subunit N-terminal domain-containing protein n=1 Tax=Notoacmeibacter marinus TaxID=1876515 RepID=A0A231UT17_9HYPH|nr:hypothetical protein [Notoacmeibacter marinus]OXS99033.1 hypothetical protein B7H23_12530 [Notoacmeibacter marinus]